MTGWRTALRMARREGRRAKGRSALVLAMIALPVAGVAFGAVTHATFTLTPEEQADRLMGSAQMAAIWPYDGPVNQHPTDSFFISDAFVPAPDAAPAPEPSLDRLLALLPPGTTAIPDQAGQLRMRTAGGVGTLAARMLNYTDPLARGIYRQLSGRAPAAVNEVALTSAAARRLGADVGDEVRPVEGDRAFRVTGIVEELDDIDASTIVLRSGALPPDELSTERRDLTYLVATPEPVTWDQVKQLNTHGVVALSRHVLANPPSPDQVALPVDGGEGDSDAAIALGLAAGVAMLEIVLLAGPAFAVGARRRRRDLALVAAAGGTPAHVRRMVLADGVVLGCVAAVVGVALGVGVAAAVRPLIEDLSGIRSGAFRVFPVALAIIAVLAVVTGVLAALVPAWIASRQDVVAALAGRRGITRSRRRWVLLGAVLGVAGAAVAGAGAWNISWPAILLGLVIVELGLVLCTPALVGLVARLGRSLSPAPRIALRDTSRNRTAAAPAISAVMAVVVASLAISVILRATDAREDAENRSASLPGQVSVATFDPVGKFTGDSEQGFPPEVAEALRSTLPVEELHEIGLPGCAEECFVEARMPPARACPYARREDELTAAQQRAARRDPRCDGAGTSYRWFGGFSAPHPTFVIDDAAAGAVLGLSAADAEPVAAALRGGAVVVDDPRYLDNGRVTFALLKIGPGLVPKGSRTVTAPGVALPERARAPVALMTEETARSLGLTVTPRFILATTSRMPTVEEADRAQAALGQRLIVTVEREPGSSSAGLLVIAIVAGVIALVAAAVATGLAATDGRADLGTLAAVGASPRVRRALSLSQSGVIAGLGSLIGVIAGVGASLAVLFALNQRYADVWPAPAEYPLTVPWLNVAIALIVVPLIAMLGAGLLTRSRLPIERRTT